MTLIGYFTINMTLVTQNTKYIQCYELKPIENKWLSKKQLLPGEPILAIYENQKLVALYSVSNKGIPIQIMGKTNSLMEKVHIIDLTHKIIPLLRMCQYIHENVYEHLSLNELIFHETQLKSWELSSLEDTLLNGKEWKSIKKICHKWWEDINITLETKQSISDLILHINSIKKLKPLILDINF